MVDLFSGDFNYNIPLMEVGGYPINLSYHSGIGMDQEASWVGYEKALTMVSARLKPVVQWAYATINHQPTA